MLYTTIRSKLVVMLKTATLNVSLRANKTAIINKNLFMNVLWVIVNFNLFPKQMKTGKDMKNCEGLEGWYLIPPKMQKKWYPACLENTSIPQLDIEITKILQEKNSNTANPSVPLLGCNNNFLNFHKGSNEIPFSEPLIQTFNFFSIQCYSFHQPLCPFSPTTTPPPKKWNI